MDFELIFIISSVVAASLVMAAILLCIPMYRYIFYAISHGTPFEDTNQKFKYAVLIPARNESNVIDHVLSSLRSQTYPSEYFDVYVIVERKDDPTVKIVEQFGYNILYRTNLHNRHRKGFAIEEAYEQIKALNKDYDSLMIFDADNFIDKDFITELNKVRATGAEVGMGYRKSTNSHKNWISGCSTLLFSMMYSLGSKGKAHFAKKVTICGTGYYIQMKLIEKEGGWIWNTLTEDAELTKYCMAKNIICDYNENAVIFDEQPTSFKQMNDQHLRWVWGFAQSTGKHKVSKKRGDVSRKQHLYNRYIHRVGIIPLVFVVISPFAYSIICFVFMGLAYVINNPSWVNFMLGAISGLTLLIIMFFTCTSFGIITDRKNLQFSFWFGTKVSLSFIIFLFDFVFAFFRGLFSKKSREWKVIEHSGEVTNKELPNGEK